MALDKGHVMEQFHHPRAVMNGRGTAARPTPQREWLLSGISGRVVELGAGDGTKLACYPPGLDEIVIVEADPSLCQAAREAASSVSTPVRVVEGSMTRLPVPDDFADVVICSLTLCSSPRPDATLAEVRRVLRRDGELRFYEHTRSFNPVVAFAEGLITPVWAPACGGCHPARDPVAAIEKVFAIRRLERFSFDHVAHVMGVAT
ncbi:class I SAM-dependent methyltransferase [Nonomuraea dietziae]|uniref:class I SAM-dependent methyltransferase n=1 Tax=Nonomuraea dietziae TaxID=65515 RepID=UPI00343516B7